LHNIAFEYDDNHTVNQVNFLEAAETQEMVEINEEIIDFLEKQTEKPTYTKIMQHLQKQGFSRNKANQALQAGKNRYWIEEKLIQNNKSVYSLITQKNNKNINYVEVEYRDKDDNLEKIEQKIIQNMKNPRTSDTSGTSPFYGVSNTCTTPVQVRTSGFV